jgi:hypothetical protein
MNGGNGGGDITSLNDFTSSYFTDSASFNARISNVYASESKYTLTSSYNNLSGSYNNLSASYNDDSASFNSRIITAMSPYRIFSGSVQVVTVDTGKVIVSGSDNLQFIVSGSGSFTGTVQAQSYFQNSLRILKENIAPFSASAVELINALDIISFNYKKNTHLFNVGIIADDSHEYFSTKDHNVMHTGNCIGMLLKAVQELYKENVELRKMISKIGRSGQ